MKNNLTENLNKLGFPLMKKDGLQEIAQELVKKLKERIYKLKLSYFNMEKGEKKQFSKSYKYKRDRSRNTSP